MAGLRTRVAFRSRRFRGSRVAFALLRLAAVVGFPFPMRGWKGRARSPSRRSMKKFPFPMRGWKFVGVVQERVIFGTFPFPMRGWKFIKANNQRREMRCSRSP